MSILWIRINFSEFQSLLVLILASIQYELNSGNTFAEAFARMTAKMNPIAIIRFFEATCHDIFEHLLATGSKDGGLFGPIFTYFGIVESNGKGILYLHCLV